MSDSGKAYEWVDKQDQAALKASPRVLAAESYLAGITSRDAEVESLQAELAEAWNDDEAHQRQWTTDYYRVIGERDEAETELAEARAVIEQVRAHAKSQRDKIRETYKSDLGYQEYANACDDVLDILDAAPSSALDAARIEAWERGRDDERQAALDKRFPDCPYRSES